MKTVLIILAFIVLLFVFVGIHEEIDWLYHYIARCELRIEALEAEKKERTDGD